MSLCFGGISLQRSESTVVSEGLYFIEMHYNDNILEGLLK